jgi:hypothetical protein
MLLLRPQPHALAYIHDVHGELLQRTLQANNLLPQFLQDDTLGAVQVKLATHPTFPSMSGSEVHEITSIMTTNKDTIFFIPHRALQALQYRRVQDNNPQPVTGLPIAASDQYQWCLLRCSDMKQGLIDEI